jgi:cardiolipin synthase
VVDAAVIPTVVSALAVIALGGVVYVLATDDRDPSVVLAWLFLIVIAPVAGVVAYFFLGRDQRRRADEDQPEVELAGPVTPPDVLESLPDTSRRLAQITRREGGTDLLSASDVVLYFAGAEKFRDLLADLQGAERHVHLMYLIWERDELTAEITRVLLDRLRAGVEVRILYDWLSSLPYKKSELRRLAEAGATVVACYRRARQLNYRNHMKMVLIDGRVVYSGGMNMGAEYIDGGSRFAVWRDTHFRMTGSVVAPYAALFASTWAANGRPEGLLTGYVDASGCALPPSGAAVQVLHSSVSTPRPAIRDLFVVALTCAVDRVWIQSPYFVPDEPLLAAMCVSAGAGVDVRLMITGHPDKKLPFFAAHAYFEHVLKAGVRVYLYDAGFMHAKTVTVDDDVTVIGTCNWDVRSLILHDEVVSVFHDSGIAKACAAQYLVDLEHAHEVRLADLRALGGLRRTRNSLCRLTSRLL